MIIDIAIGLAKREINTYTVQEGIAANEVLVKACA